MYRCIKGNVQPVSSRLFHIQDTCYDICHVGTDLMNWYKKAPSTDHKLIHISKHTCSTTATGPATPDDRRNMRLMDWTWTTWLDITKYMALMDWTSLETLDKQTASREIWFLWTVPSVLHSTCGLNITEDLGLHVALHDIYCSCNGKAVNHWWWPWHFKHWTLSQKETVEVNLFYDFKLPGSCLWVMDRLVWVFPCQLVLLNSIIASLL